MGFFAAVKEKVRDCDRNPAQAEITFGGVTEKKNIVGGVIGLAVILLALVLIVTKSIGVWNRQQLTLTSFIQRDMSQLQMGPYDIAFYLSKKTSKGWIDIPYQFYPLFGIDVFAVQIYYNFTDGTRSLKRFPMTSCDDIDDSVICAKDLVYRPLCDLDQIDEEICPAVREYDVVVFPCDRSNPFCYPEVSENLLPNLFLRDSKFNVLAMNTKQIFKSTQVSVNSAPWIIFLDQDQRVLYNVPVTKLIIQSDESILPRTITAFSQINRTQTFFYPTQTIEPVDRIRFTYALMDFYIKRSPFTQTYTRSFSRFDQMLGEVFGLIGLVSLVVGCLCSGYNRWAMRKFVEEELAKRKKEVEDVEEGEEGETKRKNKLCLYLKQSFCFSKKNEDQSLNIDLITMQRNLNKVMQILGKQNFESPHPKTTIQQQQQQASEQPSESPKKPNRKSQILQDQQIQIKQSLIVSSEGVASHHQNTDSLKE